MEYKLRNNFDEIKNIECNLLVGDLNAVKNPVLSVVIPTYKRPELLIETVQSAINQNNVDFPYEIIVVDNDDSDFANETEVLLRSLDKKNIYYYKNNRNIGGAGNWNRCIALARSNWIIMCHDDDLLKDNCLAVMRKIIIKHSKDRIPLGYVRSSAEARYEKDIIPTREKKGGRKLKKQDTALIHLTYSNVIWGGGATWAGAPTCGTLLNKTAVMEIGGYDQRLSPCFDCYVPYYMLGRYSVYKTYYPYGIYRWSENDTYKRTTLIALIKAYNDFLEKLAKHHRIIAFFSNEHYADCVLYYQSKGKEAGVNILHEDIDKIRARKYSKFKLRILYLIRKINSGFKILLAN